MSSRIKQFLQGMFVGGLFVMAINLIHIGNNPSYISQTLSVATSLITLYVGSRFVS
jgi:hypothetical protein